MRIQVLSILLRPVARGLPSRPGIQRQVPEVRDEPHRLPVLLRRGIGGGDQESSLAGPPCNVAPQLCSKTALGETMNPFRARFDQLAVYENRRTPILLLEEQYNRAKLCWDMHDELVALLGELIDIEGPQPGTAAWAHKVHAALGQVAQTPDMNPQSEALQPIARDGDGSPRREGSEPDEKTPVFPPPPSIEGSL